MQGDLALLRRMLCSHCVNEFGISSPQSFYLLVVCTELVQTKMNVSMDMTLAPTRDATGPTCNKPDDSDLVHSQEGEPGVYYEALYSASFLFFSLISLSFRIKT